MLNEQRLNDAIRGTVELLGDGFDPSDYATLLRSAMLTAEACDDLTGREKRELATRYVDAVLQEFMQAGETRAALRAAAPGLCDLVIEAVNEGLFGA